MRRVDADTNVYGTKPPEAWYGHAADAYEYVEYRCAEADCGRQLKRLADGTFIHLPKRDFLGSHSNSDAGRYEKEVEKAEAASRLSTPYKGAIKQCQAHVSQNMGRWTHFHRCENAPKWVRDGMAVCTTHAKAPQVQRWRGETNKYKGISAPADEPLEPEYMA